MFDFIKRLWQRPRDGDATGGHGDEPAPLLDLIRAWDGEDELELPDDGPPDWDLGEVRFASGAIDGILLNHITPPEDEETSARARAIADAVEQVAKTLAEADMERLYAVAREEALITAGDAIVDELRRREGIDSERLWAIGKWLVETATHREPLKLGILILGLGATDDDIETLKVLARHDEFTLFAAVAIGNLCENPADHWLELARTVRGWGKIHLVERLTEWAPERADIRDWLLREGCGNEVEEGYLAYLCASAGDLAGALAAEEIDDQLLDGALTITLSLIEGGPSVDIQGYEEGAVAVGHLIGHVEGRCNTIQRLYTVLKIAEWLRWLRPTRDAEFEDGVEPPDAETLDALETMGWSGPVRRELLGRCERLISAPDWPDKLRAAYKAGKVPESGLAFACAEILRIDLWPIAMKRLQKAPHDQMLYFDLMRTADRSRRQEVIAFAEDHLPLDRLASGPALELGLGEDWEARGALDCLLQEMERQGPYSDILVAAAMRSPVIRHRLQACAILLDRDPESWGELIEDALNLTLGDEPDEDVREQLQSLGRRLTAGEP
jgi:hypothetical protein